MRKILVLMLLLGVILIWADLEDSEIVVSSGSVIAGDSIAISVTTTEILDDWDVISFQFEINYDPTAVTFSSYEIGEVFAGGGSLIMNELEPGYFRAAFAHYEAQSGAGEVVSIYFIGITGESDIDIHDFKYNATTIDDTSDGHITVVGGNQLPIADAGIDQQVNEGEEVTLNGSESYDPEGENITYLWDAPEDIILSNPTIANPTFTAPTVTEDTGYQIFLVVNDGEHDSLPSEILINVINVNGNDDIPALITQVGIHSISPNPFNPTTTIKFLVPINDTSVELKIFTVKGQLVKTMVLDNLSSNSVQQVIWNGTDNSGNETASGVYFCRILGSSSSASARMLLLK